MQTSGIVFYFEHKDLKDQLALQIDKNNKKIGRLETELPDQKAKITDMEKSGRARSQEYTIAQQTMMMLENELTNLRNQNGFLSFYAAHLPPGNSELTLQDVRHLGFVEPEYAIALANPYPH